MTQFVGADPAQLRALSKQMAKSAERVGSSLRNLSSLLDAPGSWLGPDMQGFRQRWQDELMPRSKAVVQSLLQASKALQANADEQEKTSQSAGGQGSGQPDGGGHGGGDRRDESRGSAGSRTGRGEEGTDPGGHTPGEAAYPGGLGEPVPGEDVPKPESPPWKSDGDSQEHGSEDAGLEDHATKLGVEAAANSAAPVIPSASPSGATGPLTYPVSTDWKGYYIGKDESADWFYASGGISYSTQGQVTVYPPATAGGEWTYRAETAVSYRDRYNWDGGKSTDIGPLNVSDEQLGRLNKVGIAQNYNMTGESSTHHSSGSVK